MTWGLWRFPHVTRAELASRQDARLRRLVAHAYARVPYYRELFDRHGVHPGEIRGVADLPRIPITTKRDLLARAPEELVARGARGPFVVMRTSGSSGERFTLRRTPWEQYVLHSARLRAYRAYGVRTRDHVARIGIPRARGLLSRRVFGRPLGDLALTRQTLVDTFLPPETIAATLERLRPDVLGGFAGVLARVAEAASAGGQVVRPRVVITGSEVLTPAMRRTIETAFAAPVRNVYGSTEFNLLAWECPAGGPAAALHTCDDGAIVEVVRDGRPAGPGERGEVVATNLHAWAMPLIRYHQGDVVTRGDDRCPCGLPFGTIRDVQGRMIDYFPLPDGRLVHPYEIVARFRDAAPWIRQYQLLQERTDRVVLRAVATDAPSAERIAAVAAAISALLGPAVAVAVTVVPEIPLEPSGKFRVSRSLVRSAYEAADVAAASGSAA
jgi:phenylacetate-CoA ligase